MKYYEMKSFRFQVAEDTELELVNAMELPDVEFEWFTKSGNTIKIKRNYPLKHLKNIGFSNFLLLTN